MIAGAAQAQSIPANTVIKVRLLGTLHSETAQVGDRVRVQVAEEGSSGLDGDTVLVGRVTEAQPATKSRPGIIDLRFGTIERDGGWQPVSGGLSSLSEREVKEDASGRLVGKPGRRDKAKFIGYGAAGGAVVGYLLKNKTDSLVKGALVGALAGYLYGESQKDAPSFRNVDLKEGAQFGVILDRPLRVRRSAMVR
jgi:hypothetical protein